MEHKYIDADALMRKLDNLRPANLNTLYAVESIICDMPAADVEPMRKWIPANTPPDNNRKVLIAFCSKDDKNDIFIDTSKWCEACYGFLSSGEMHWVPPREHFSSNFDVIAWQELPEPPKMDGGSEE